MDNRLVVLAALLVIGGCAEDNGPSETEIWTSEPLHSGMEISFPSDYEGEGIWCGMDACWFNKERVDGEIEFYISVWGMTGGLPVHFDTLPDQFRFPEREFMETNSGLSGVFFYESEGSADPDECRGAFVVEMNDASGYIEAVRVSYQRAERSSVKEILRTIRFN